MGAEGAPESPQKQALVRDEEGKFVGPQPNAFKPGESGNPGGAPKGQSITKYLRKFFASVEVQGKIGRRLIALMESGRESDIMRALELASSTDLAREKLEGADDGAEKRDKVVRLEGEDSDSDP